MATIYADEAIRQNVWDEILHDVRIDPSYITVSVSDGEVELDGSVLTYSQKRTASEDARRVKGVVDVINNLNVSPTATLTDDEILDKVSHSIDRDSRITDPFQIDVTVNQGVVILSGTVPSYGQRRAAEEDAWAAPGMIDVVDKIVLEPPRQRPDAEVQDDVDDALDSDPDINAARIAVEVVDGIVYLRGTVPTYYQIGEESDVTWSIRGVRDVVNELTVT